MPTTGDRSAIKAGKIVDKAREEGAEEDLLPSLFYQLIDKPKKIINFLQKICK